MTGFFRIPPSHGFNALDICCNFITNYLTVSLTEELFFRGLLYTAFTQYFGDHKILGVVCSSLVFGVMHWPRADILYSKVLYAMFASITGMIYCTSYIFAGNNIFVSAVVHAITDTTWYHVFQ